MFNARGELLGLAFDGNWEAMSSDILYEPKMQRCIGVDVRYILFMIEKYGNCLLYTSFAALKLLFIFLNIALNLIYYVWMKGDDVAYAFLFNLVCTSTIMLCMTM